MAQDAIRVDDLLIRYSVAGHGSDVVFVHGWGASRRMWAPVAALLTEHFRCWSLDLPGCGESDQPGDHWFSIPNFTAVLQGFLAGQGLRGIGLVGHSMGGMIALDLAARHPELVRRLAVINPVVTGRTRLRPLASAGARRRLLAWLLRLSPRVLQPALAAGRTLRVPGVQHLARRSEDFYRVSPAALLASGRAILTCDLSPQLARIRVPTLVIVGRVDLNVPNAEGRLAASRIPGARLKVLRAGHLATDDRPAEVAALLQDFFA